MKSIYMIVFLFHILTSLTLAEEITGSEYGNRSCSDETVLKSLPSDKLVPVEFVNQGNEPVTIYWLNSDGHRVWYYNLAAQSSYTQNAYVANPWVITDSNNNCLGIYVVESEGATQKVVIKQSSQTVSNAAPVVEEMTGFENGNRACSDETVLKSLRADKAVPVEFINQGSEPVTIYWLNYDGERVRYYTLAAKNSYYQNTFVTQPWLIVDGNNNCLGIYVVESEGATQKVIIKQSSQSVSNAAPLASFTTSPGTGTAPLAVNLNASGSTDSDGSISSYAWSSSDGQKAIGKTANLTFTKAMSALAVGKYH